MKKGFKILLAMVLIFALTVPGVFTITSAAEAEAPAAEVSSDIIAAEKAPANARNIDLTSTSYTYPKAYSYGVRALNYAGVVYIKKGTYYQVQPYLNPSFKNPSVTYKSSKTSVASVGSTGKIKGKKTGSATIYVKFSGYGTIKVKVKVVTSTAKYYKIYPTSSITVRKGAYYKVVPSGTLRGGKKAPEKVYFSSSNKSVATVNSYGTVKGIKAGTATITMKSKSGKKAKTKVTVVSIPTTPASSTKGLNISAITYTPETYAQSFTAYSLDILASGKITNNTGVPIDYIYLKGTGYNKSGTNLGTAGLISIYDSNNPIMPGQTRSFYSTQYFKALSRISLTSLDVDTVSGYEVPNTIAVTKPTGVSAITVKKVSTYDLGRYKYTFDINYSIASGKYMYVKFYDASGTELFADYSDNSTYLSSSNTTASDYFYVTGDVASIVATF